MVASKVKAGEAFVEFSLQDQFSGGLKSIGANLQKFGAGVAKVGAIVTGIGASIVAPLLLATEAASRFGDTIDKAFQRTQVSTERLSGLSLAAERTGTDFATLEKAILRSSRVIVDANRGLETYKRTFRDLGLSAQELENQSPEEQFLAIADAISKVENPTKQAALAQEVFGKSGAKLLPLLREGREGLEAYQRRAEELGIVLNREEAKSLATYRDGITDLRTAIRGVQLSIGTALAETLGEPLFAIATIIGQTAKWIRENKSLVIGIFAVGAALVALGTVITAVGVGIILLGSLISAVGTIAALPFIVPLAAAGALLLVLGSIVAAFLVFTKTGRTIAANVGNAFKAMFEVISAVFGNVIKLLVDGRWADAGRLAALQFRFAFENALRVAGLPGVSLIELTDAERKELSDLASSVKDFNITDKFKDFFQLGEVFGKGAESTLDQVLNRFKAANLQQSTNSFATAIRLENLNEANRFREPIENLRKEVKKRGEEEVDAINELRQDLLNAPIARIC